MIEYKIVLLGSGGVGKSALTVQYISEVFVERYDPTIEDSYRKQVEIDGNQYLLEILDTAGTEQFTAMRDMYMRNGHGFILVYSIIQQDSFAEIKDIYTRICNVKEEDSVPMVLVGNKADLDDHRVVSKQQGQNLAKSFQNAIFMEASAKTRQNVSEIFTSLVRLINQKNPDFHQKKPKRCLIL